jgi:ankyrin repeat protein
MEIRASTPQIQAMLQASAAGNLDLLQEVEDADLVRPCKTGCQALHWAAGSNQVQTVEYLIQSRGLDVDSRATKKARDRTPLHYACRNGCIEAARCLVEEHGADANAIAKHGVTPFQLAVWRNHLEICQWLVRDCNVDPSQVNDFDCGSVHWLGIAPIDRADSLEAEDGSVLLPLARWLAEQSLVDFSSRQRQGHSALHKAAWGGHVALCRYLHEEHNLWDDAQDDAGNFAADLCDMANTARHADVANYLRNHCSRERAQSCAVLGIPEDASDTEIRQAYLTAARKVHPDRSETSAPDDFDAVQKAYKHLTVAKGRGSQSNPTHSLKLMLQVSGVTSEQKEDDCFKARLVAVLLEYGEKGLDLSNLKKKWSQVWPDAPFPAQERSTKGRGVLSEWIRQEAGDVVNLQTDEKGGLRLYAKNCTQAQVAAAAATVAQENAKE